MIEGINTAEGLDQFFNQYSNVISPDIKGAIDRKRVSIIAAQRKAEAREAAAISLAQKRAAFDSYSKAYGNILSEKDESRKLDLLDGFLASYAKNDPKNHIPELMKIRPKVYLDAYHQDYKGLHDYNSMYSFVEKFKANDPERLTVIVRNKMPSVKAAEDAVAIRREREQKESEKKALVKDFEIRITNAKKWYYQAEVALNKEKEVSELGGVVNLDRQYQLARNVQNAKDSLNELYLRYRNLGGSKQLSDM